MCCFTARCLLLTVLAAGLLASSSCSQKDRLAPEEDFDGGSVGTFSLKERHGDTVTSDILEGKVWIACFIFTRCSSGCPQITSTMVRLQRELNLASEDRLRLVSITVDPRHDDPTELQRYANSFEAHPDRWLFLTGTQEVIHELLLNQFKVSVAENPGDKRTPGDEFSHSGKLVLIDARGHIRGYFDGLPASHTEEAEYDFEKNLTKLRRVAAILLREGPR